MIDREKIAGRIRALLAKTVENGCTEDEAIAAAAKAADLLRQYNLTLDEVELRAAPFSRHQETDEWLVGERLWKPASAIAELTGARYWITAAGVYPAGVTFFGFDHEVEVARYMIEICGRAMRSQLARLKRENALLRPARQQLVIRPYLDGMADRLRDRIRELKEPEPTGTGLIVLRGALIDAALAQAGIHLHDASARASRAQDAGYLEGRRAADQVALNRGLAGSAASQRALTGRR